MRRMRRLTDVRPPLTGENMLRSPLYGVSGGGEGCVCIDAHDYIEMACCW